MQISIKFNRKSWNMYGWSKFFVAGFLDDDLYFKENVLLFEITERISFRDIFIIPLKDKKPNLYMMKD